MIDAAEALRLSLMTARQARVGVKRVLAACISWGQYYFDRQNSPKETREWFLRFGRGGRVL